MPKRTTGTVPVAAGCRAHIRPRAELIADLETEEGQDQYLLGVLAMAAFHRRGLSLNDDEVYAYAPPPIVTGSFDVDAIRVFPFSMVVNLAGQLHQQFRG